MDDPFLIICSSCGGKNKLDADLCTNCGADLLTGKVVDSGIKAESRGESETESIPLKPLADALTTPDSNPFSSPLVHDEQASDMRRRLTRTFSKTRRLEAAISSALDSGMTGFASEPLFPDTEFAGESDTIQRLMEQINNYFKSEKLRDLVSTICMSMTKPLQEQFSEIIRTEVLDRLDEHVAHSMERHVAESGGNIDAAMVRGVVRSLLDEEHVLRSMDALDFVHKESLTEAVEQELRSQINGLVNEAVEKALPGGGAAVKGDVARKPEVELRLQAEIKRLEDKIEKKGPDAPVAKAEVEKAIREMIPAISEGKVKLEEIKIPGNIIEVIQQTFLDMRASEEIWQLLERKMREVSLDLYSDMMEGVHDYMLDKMTSYSDSMSSRAGEMIRAEIAARLPGVLAGFLNTGHFQSRLRDVLHAAKAGMDAGHVAAIRNDLMNEIQNALGSGLFKNAIKNVFQDRSSDLLDTVLARVDDRIAQKLGRKGEDESWADSFFNEEKEDGGGVVIPSGNTGDQVKALFDSPEFPLMLRRAVQAEASQFGGGSPADAENVRMMILDYVNSPDMKDTIGNAVREEINTQISEQLSVRIEEENQELAGVIIGKVEELLPAYLERQFYSENFQAYVADLVAHYMNPPAQDYQDESGQQDDQGGDFFSQM
ncbi:MAG: hypothetical protein ACYS8W_13870 [Planctomycetota bacterium]|jgi:hypothetical protein